MPRRGDLRRARLRARGRALSAGLRAGLARCSGAVLDAAARVRPLWSGHGALEYEDADVDGVYDRVARLAWRGGCRTGDAYWAVRLGAIATARAVRAGDEPSRSTVERAAGVVALFERCARVVDPEGVFAQSGHLFLDA